MNGNGLGGAEANTSLAQFEAFLDVLTPQTRRYVLDWLVLPWTMGELVEGEPDGEVVLQELMGLGVLRMVNGSLELYASDWKGR